MNLRQAAQQALEALKLIDDAMPFPVAKLAMKNLRERLAQPEMQPCAGRNCGSTNPNLHSAECFEDYEKATGMRAWQGLTDGEIDALAMDEDGLPNSHIELARAIEAKLREKNA